MRIFAVVLRETVQPKLQPPIINQKLGVLKRLFGKHLLFTNTISSGILMGLGDFCQQRIEIFQAKTNEKTFDKTRTVNMTAVGFGHGVFHHFFYGWIDRVLPGRRIRTVMYKILVDQAIASPSCMWIFFTGMAILERRGYEAGWLELKKKFLFTYMVDWVVWPPSQFINFYYVPTQYRVIYINSLTMLYDVFLSYIKFYDQIGETKGS